MSKYTTLWRLGSGEYSYEEDSQNNHTKREYKIPDKENPSITQEESEEGEELDEGEEAEIEEDGDHYYDPEVDGAAHEAAKEKQLPQQEEEESEEKEM